jgi:hypothetical protein
VLAFLSLDELIRECETAGLPGLRPHTTLALCAVRDVVLEALDNADAGLLVLAVDGLGWRSAATGWTRGRLVCLTSTFPSTSVTAWTSAVTGLDVGAHLGAGMCVRVPVPDVVAHVVMNRPMGFVGLEDPGARSWADIDAVLRLLEEAALRWAGRGWTVHAYGDHGQTACRRNPALEALWNRLDDPRFCRLPCGGAGRTRWLFPRSDRRSDVFSTLRDGLGEHALVSSPEGLAGHGLWRLTPELRERVGDVVAVAASDEFPLPEPALPFEHGALTPEEMLVPFASWSAGQSRESGG